MNRFRFRFESVLRYREIVEDGKKRDFGVALNHLRHEEASLRRIDDTISSHETRRETRGSGRISARDLQNMYDYSRRLDSDYEQQEKAIETAARELDARRNDLVEATKRKKIFERLQERDREIYDIEVRKEEQTASDEISSQRFNTSAGQTHRS